MHVGKGGIPALQWYLGELMAGVAKALEELGLAPLREEMEVW